MRRLSKPEEMRVEVSIDFEGKTLPALDGEPLACALLASGENVLSRSIKYHRPRGPYCFSAACSNCLVRVDGVPNVFACRTMVRDGMKIERQNSFPSASFDVFSATDWLFPKGMDHHEMFAGVPVAEKMMLKVTRHLAGLGKLPDKEATLFSAPTKHKTLVAIVGAGAAGLAAAQTLQNASVDFLLFDRNSYLGGRLVDGIPTGTEPLSQGVSVSTAWSQTTALGFYQDAHGDFLLAMKERGLVQIYAQHWILAAGGHPNFLPFENGDLPGIFYGRAVSQLIRCHQLVPGKKFALVGEGDELDALAKLLETAGAQVVVVASKTSGPRHEKFIEASVLRAVGRNQVKGLVIKLKDGSQMKINCDAVAICHPPSPSFELAEQLGAQVTLDEKFHFFKVVVDAQGKTTHPSLWAAGEVTGVMNVQEAWESGRSAAKGLLLQLGLTP